MSAPRSRDDDLGFRPWTYAAGLALWVVYIGLVLAGLLRPWRLVVGFAAGALWIHGGLVRRRWRRRLATDATAVVPAPGPIDPSADPR